MWLLEKNKSITILLGISEGMMAWERGYGHITLPHGYGYIYGTKGKGCVTEFFYIVKYSLEMR